MMCYSLPLLPLKPSCPVSRTEIIISNAKSGVYDIHIALVLLLRRTSQHTVGTFMTPRSYEILQECYRQAVIGFCLLVCVVARHGEDQGSYSFSLLIRLVKGKRRATRVIRRKSKNGTGELEPWAAFWPRYCKGLE